MTGIDLAQNEADELIGMEKHRESDVEYDFPAPGDKVSIPLLSPDKREEFLLDIYRGRIELLKVKFQNRHRKVVILVRLDIGGPPHRNPDNEEVSCPHIHVYREGYGDKWAHPIDSKTFSDTSNLWKTLADFQRYCNITQPPNFRKGLFV